MKVLRVPCCRDNTEPSLGAFIVMIDKKKGTFRFSNALLDEKMRGLTRLLTVLAHTDTNAVGSNIAKLPELLSYK